MAQRATTNWDGSDGSVQEMPSAGGVHRSTDYQTPGIEVQRGFHKATVTSADQLADEDIVSHQGVEMSAKMARSLGLMGEVFAPVRTPQQLDQDLSAGNATQRQEDRLGVPEYDHAVDGLNESLEAGVMEIEEAQEYDTAVAQIVHSGLSIEHALETLEGIASGEVDVNAVPGDVKTMLTETESKVTQAATKSAQNELGADGFAWLQNAAQTHQGVDRVIRHYAIDRATGKAGDVSWGDLVNHIRQQLGA